MSSPIIYFIISAIILKTEAARILAVVPTPSLSHQIVFHPIVKELAKNHQVVFITTNPAFKGTDIPANLTEIDVQELSYGIWKKEFTLSDFGKENFIYKGVKSIVEIIPEIFEEQLKHDQVQAMLKDKKPFDLILLQAWFRPALVFSHIYNIPVIKVSSFGMLFDNAENMGVPFHPIFYPDVFHQRIYNLGFWETITELYKRYYVEQLFDSNEVAENELVRRNFGDDVPPLRELKKNVHMLFLNVHPIWERNRPVPKNVVYIGNIHQKPKKDLPQDIQSFLDGSPQGAIYMSFGTNVPPSKLPPGIVKTFLKVFSSIPYRVLLKWDQDQLEDKPENIMISKWFPQSDIFRHPNLKLVITQGGLQTAEEAISNALPVIGFPMLADQWLNVEHLVHHGVGLQLDMETLEEEGFREAVMKVIEDESFRKNAVRLRSVILDQQEAPLDRAIRWIEYTLKHGGASHLRPATANLSRSEYIQLELLIILLLVIITIVSIIGYSLILVWRIIKYLLNLA